MFETIKLIWKYNKLEALDAKLQRLTAARKAVKEDAREVQAEYEALYEELQLISGGVKITPELVTKKD